MSPFRTSIRTFFTTIINIIILTFHIKFSRIKYSLFGDRQTICLAVFNTKFVVKSAVKILKMEKELMFKINLNRDFALAREVI